MARPMDPRPYCEFAVCQSTESFSMEVDRIPSNLYVPSRSGLRMLPLYWTFRLFYLI